MKMEAKSPNDEVEDTHAECDETQTLTQTTFHHNQQTEEKQNLTGTNIFLDLDNFLAIIFTFR